MGRWGPSLRVKQTEHESNHELKNLPFVNNALMTLKVAIGEVRHSRQPTCFIVSHLYVHYPSFLLNILCMNRMLPSVNEKNAFHVRRECRFI
jgi:hypothetical protein